MLTFKQILVSTLVLGGSVLNLTGCGQTGALYLPTRNAPAKPAEPALPASTDRAAPLSTETAPQ